MITIFKFYIDKNKELTGKSICRILEKFTSEVVPQMKQYRGYYDGTGHKILNRVIGDATRPNNKIVVNYCKNIVDNMQGYITGNPITYAAKNENDISLLLDCFEENDIINSDSTLLRNALIYGVAYQLCYVNENNQHRFKNIDSSAVIPIYANDLDGELLYCIYFTNNIDWDSDEVNNRYDISVYSRDEIFYYTADSGFKDIRIAKESEPHYFGEVPFVVFDLNDENQSLFDCIISLQDAYNKLISDEVNDFEAFVDAYMVLKGVSAEPEDLAAMKQSRTILLDADDEVSYLTKQINDTQIQNMLKNINDSIHKVSNSPDFNSTEFNNGVSSGIALQYKLVGFNNVASNIEPQLIKAIQKRIELLNKINALVNTEAFEVDVVITHNLAVNISDVVSWVNALRGIVSDKTLLSQLPFVDDVEEELERVDEQNERMSSIYSFDGHKHEAEENEALESVSGGENDNAA